jgi:hypothetical protein
VAGVRLLHTIHRKRADRVYAQLVKLGIMACAFIGHQCLAHRLALLFTLLKSQPAKDNSQPLAPRC